MTAVAVTGAAGSVGRRVTQLLASDPSVAQTRAFDRVRRFTDPRVDFHQVELAEIHLTDLTRLLAGCDTVVHLADDPTRRADPAIATLLLDRVLQAAAQAGCGHVVLLSSALVYGAYPDNPVPLTEAHPRRPAPTLAYARTKARLEEAACTWAASTGARLAILRPTTTLSEFGASYIAAALRAASTVRPATVGPPVQFLHHDDLASAVAMVAARGLDSVYNVAPDAWIAPEMFDDLVAEAELRLPGLSLPEPLDSVAGALTRALLALRPSAEPGLDAYVNYPWVIANDRLRAAGWQPSFTNEEAYVLGTPPPLWRRYTLRRRQELALAALVALGLAGLAASAAAGFAARRHLRPH